MTEYQMRKEAKLIAEYIVDSLKNDPDLLDQIYPPRYMNIEEAAAFVNIPKGTFYKKINEIPHVKVGKRLVFSDRELTRWMNRKKDKI